LELQKLLDEVASKKKNPVQQVEEKKLDVQPGSSRVQVSLVKVLTEVINIDPISPPGFDSSKVLASSVSERSVISLANIISQANVQLGLEAVNIPKPAIPVSALKFGSTSSIEVLDEEILMIPEKEKDSETPFTQIVESISIPNPESRSVPSSGNKEDQVPEIKVLPIPEPAFIPTADSFIPLSSEFSMFTSSESI